MVIDIHTHVFPRQKAPAILDDMAKRKGIPHYTDGTVDGLLDVMEKSGTGISLISRITTKKENVTAVNGWLAKCMRPSIHCLATVHPDQPVASSDLETLKAQGFRGVKLHPDYQGFFVDDRRMYPFYEAAQATGMPVLFHAGLDRGLPPPVHAMPSGLLKVHRDFPQLLMIAAHMGGEDNYAETEALLLGENIFIDTAFVLRIMPFGLLKRFFRKHGVERILFGSDSPFKDQAKELAYLLNLSFLTTAEKEKVSGQNARSLLF
jgi:predicted TIM-barrel fold metal-dependent hydrolase